MRHVVFALLALALVGPAPAPKAQSSTQAIPFQFVLQRQIVFPMTINGKAAEAWLDSGAGATVVDAAFARQIGLSLGPPIQAHGVTGEVAGVRLAQADLSVGELSMPGRGVVVMDLSPVQRIVQRPVQVLLGRDIFEAAIVDLDFPRRTLSLLSRDRFIAPNTAPLPLKRSGDLRSVPVRVAGIDMAAILDLGNSDALLIDHEFADHYGFFKGRRLSTTLGLGADGAHVETLTSLDQVELGGARFSGVPTTATADLSSKAPANVGLQLLSRFHLTIDFVGERVWMTPEPNATIRPFRRNRAGLGLAPGPGRLTVIHVAKGSPAQRGGWKTGDVVTALDGQAIAASYATSETSLWIYGPAGRTVTLTLADGRTRKLTLADYY